ncbi:MAG TPA: alpha/beta hydrolase [Cytophagales bacterium]|nr:alpha/beta hydrolase [Cytophagales bacterium]HAA17609.1 alpha/beta hydrolase [Cytophagales bacterium]HAP63972.1 alpha/beta hydrolase [Cytophagales bacterium]
MKRVAKKWVRRKRFWALVLLVGFLVFAYDFLQLRYSDQSYEAFFEEAGLAELSSIDYHIQGARRLRYVEVGHDTLPLLVLIHGAPSSSAYWRSYLKDSTLLANAKLMAVDRPGYGYSGFGKHETSIAKQAELIAAVLKEKRTQHQEIVLHGSSYGGTVAARLAMDYPELVDGILFQSSSLAPGEETTYWITYPTSHWALSWMIPATFRVANAEKLSHEEELLKMEPLWHRIRSAVTILHGTDDGLIFPSNATYAQEHLTKASFVDLIMVPGQGHDLTWSRPQLLKESMVNMLNRVREAHHGISGNNLTPAIATRP